MDGIWFLYVILGAFPALLIFAVAYKFFEVVQASYWSSAPGRIVLSTSETRSVKAGNPDSSDTELRNFPKIEYAYTVAGQSYRGSRVTIGEDMGNFEVAETIARYPVGKEVTVFYNPNRRGQSVLERDMPPGFWRTAVVVIVVLIAMIVAGVVGFGKLGELMLSVVPNPKQAPFVTACLGFALFASLIIHAIQKNAAHMRHWPKVPGRVESAGVRSFTVDETNNRSTRSSTRYRADIVYSYEVGGVPYRGDKVGTGQVSASTDALVRRAVEGFTPGSAVQVHYNPENPAEAIVRPGGGGLYALWLVPAALVALAVFVAY